ncbi:AAA domain-containing protein [Rhizobium leguminosarum]|uniref:AAA domain-containing protein n=1 Tax=Rhizobium leguminosarum TaxID=384 RepID=UPI0013EE6D90|nr:AAA domain-containing protein [Rhizobium leguminosarum]
MQIKNCGRGIHKNEIAGIDKLRNLPASWYAFTNLDISLSAGTTREVDVILITSKRVLIIDLKNWGTAAITGTDGRWYLDGVDHEPSPVQKVLEIKRHLYQLLKKELGNRQETRKLPVPRIDGVVALIGNNERSGIPATERASVFTADDLIKQITDDRRDRETFGSIAGEILSRPLTDPFWKEHLTRFFNGGGKSPLEPGRRKFDRYVPEEVSVFNHPGQIYREFEAREAGTPPNLGTLRLWDFAKVTDTRFQNAEARSEIVGRERRVYHWLRDRADNLEKFLLAPRVDDTSGGVDYWEVFDRRRRLKRLSDWSATEKDNVTAAGRTELARQLLSAVAEFHRVDAAHLDLGGHSIWLEMPTTVRLSHLFAARHPSVKTLGEARYNFLASVTLPEDLLGVKSDVSRRDVYLLGVAVHQILFGQTPEGEPPEWDAAVDPDLEFQHLHDWFAEMLDVDPQRRFANARNALEMFNRATTEHPTPQEVRTSLEKYRLEIRSQRALAAKFPLADDLLRESDRVDVWRSTVEGEDVLVKLWKQAAWGDLDKEGKRVLSFLDAASNAKIDAPAGISKIRGVYWLSDAFALVQDWAAGKTLAELLEHPPADWLKPEVAIEAVKRLESAVSRLHEASLAHGDLKPDNIVLTEANDWFFIDFFDFSPTADGDLQNGNYSAGGDRFQRDRFAVTKLAEEMLAVCYLPVEIAVGIAKAIDTCRTKEPRLTTLLPLAEALERALAIATAPLGEPGEAGRQILISVRNAEVGPIEPDEGRYFVRTMGLNQTGPAKVIIRGASEELEVKLDDNGKPRACYRRTLTLTRIAIISRFENFSFEGSVAIHTSTHNDLSQLEPLITELVSDKAVTESGSAAPDDIEDASAPAIPEEEAEESLTELVAEEAANGDVEEVDVPLLWRELITIEKELTTDARVILDSSFDRSTRRHVAAIELESGSFDFDRNDTVGVQRQSKGGWRRIGELDLSRSTATIAVIEPPQFSGPPHGSFLEEGQRLRFVSHFEAESLRRRSGAVDRILAREGRAGNLVSVFDPRSAAEPTRIEHMIDEEQLASYELNDDQTRAFRAIVAARPVGLLQGPPGTGKTRFIAALAHYAITKGLARNVLLSSQAHEAVNTAAEALLRLFRTSGGDPSILRVAMSEDQVSDQIREFHTPKVEQSLKDRFSATFSERMAIVGKSIGVDREAVNDVLVFQQQVLPMAMRLEELLVEIDEADARVTGLRGSLELVLEKLGLPSHLAAEVGSPFSDFQDEALYYLMEKHSGSGISADKIKKLQAVAGIGRDFVSSASRYLRSFEPFLAGTRQIVAGTCVGLGRTSLGLTNTSFDLVIIDEAARCTASELLVPLQAARWAVLVGDQAQLEPQHRAEVVDRVAKRTNISKREIKRSDFERVFEATYGTHAGARLATQYRMLEPIGKLVSEAFYPDLTLKAGRHHSVLPSDVLPEPFDRPLTWIDTAGMSESAFEGKVGEFGRVNRMEADAIVKTLEEWLRHTEFSDWLVGQREYPFGIGVICMYAAQRDLLRKIMLRSALGEHLDRRIKIGTVDSYQGKENPIVLLSLVRNNREGKTAGNSRFIKEGFLATPNRINVAASRALDRLVIVGSRSGWRHGGPVAQMTGKFDIALGQGHARRIDAADMLTPRDKLRAAVSKSEATDA